MEDAQYGERTATCRRLGFVTRTFPNIEAELSSSIKSVEVVRYVSSVLSARRRYGHKTKALEVSLAMGSELRDYANTELSIIDD